MSRSTFLSAVLLALTSTIAITSHAAAPAKLTAAEIVDKNIEARGGLQKWRSVHSLAWTGKMDAGGNNQPRLRIPGQSTPPPPKDPNAQTQLPFTLELQRPRLSRLEIEFNGQKAVQVYDGKEGWKLRPFLNRDDVEAFTADELKIASTQADLDGPLVDYAAKGTKIELVGVEKVEGKDAYQLKLTLKDGHVMHEWIDAQSFLEVKMEGTPRLLDKRPHAVTVYLRDYRSVDGLKIPYVIETVVQGVQRTEKIEIDKVTINPKIEESRFAKPTQPGGSV